MPARTTSVRVRACATGLLLAASPALLGCSSPAGSGAPREWGGAGAGATTAGPAAGTTGAARVAYDAEEADRAAVEAMLARRAHAVRVGDEAAFLATVDRRDPRLVDQQRTLFANLAQLRLARYDYETTAEELLADPVRGAAPRDPVVRFQTVEHTQVADAWTGAVGNEVRMTYVRRDGRWLVGRETASEHASDGGRLRPWFGGPVDVADRGTLVVLADAADAGLAEDLADIVEDAVVADAALLRVAPAQRVLVDATGNGPTVRLNTVDDEEAAAIYTGVSDLDAQGRRTTASGAAIRVNPALTAEEITGDPGLLRHEVVHLLLRRYAGVLPMWLSEGLAEYARWHPLTTADLRVPPALWRRTREAPRDLPDTGVFQLDPAVNYLVSQAAAQHLLEVGGTKPLHRLLEGYRADGATAGVRAYGDDPTPELLREVYGTTEAGVVRGAWRALDRLAR